MSSDLNDYDYELPEELIAQYPAAGRTSSRLMGVDRALGRIAHHAFEDLADLLDERYFLVFNDTKVLPARLPALKTTGGKSEIFFLKALDEFRFYGLARGRLQEGAQLIAGEYRVTAEKKLKDGTWVWSSPVPVKELLDTCGKLPLPPYIQREPEKEDLHRYQTVYAQAIGSVAAPTAGLHFSRAFLDKLAAKGIPAVYLTLHVGIGTFRPIKADNLDEHVMHSEFYTISPESAARINALKKEGRKLLAVGTTSVRTLESAADENGIIHPESGETTLFIRPGYRFKAVDAMLTNFHLPKSSLLLLVSAFMGSSLCRQAYRQAVQNRYRFFSYGDAMVIL